MVAAIILDLYYTFTKFKLYLFGLGDLKINYKSGPVIKFCHETYGNSFFPMEIG